MILVSLCSPILWDFFIIIIISINKSRFLIISYIILLERRQCYNIYFFFIGDQFNAEGVSFNNFQMSSSQLLINQMPSREWFSLFFPPLIIPFSYLWQLISQMSRWMRVIYLFLFFYTRFCSLLKWPAEWKKHFKLFLSKCEFCTFN